MWTGAGWRLSPIDDGLARSSQDAESRRGKMVTRDARRSQAHGAPQGPLAREPASTTGARKCWNCSRKAEQHRRGLSIGTMKACNGRYIQEPMGHIRPEATPAPPPASSTARRQAGKSARWGARGWRAQGLRHVWPKTPMECKRTFGQRGERDAKAANHHPTVKPLALMRYLCRLVTPPNGLVLDPFMGSGSTLIAAEQEGFRAIGIELSPEYCAIAEKRLSAAQSDNSCHPPMLHFVGTSTP